MHIFSLAKYFKVEVAGRDKAFRNVWGPALCDCFKVYVIHTLTAGALVPDKVQWWFHMHWHCAVGHTHMYARAHTHARTRMHDRAIPCHTKWLCLIPVGPVFISSHILTSQQTSGYWCTVVQCVYTLFFVGLFFLLLLSFFLFIFVVFISLWYNFRSWLGITIWCGHWNLAAYLLCSFVFWSI